MIMTTMMMVTIAKNINTNAGDIHHDHDDDDDSDAHHRFNSSTFLLGKQARYHILIWHRLMSGNVYWLDNSWK